VVTQADFMICVEDGEGRTSMLDQLSDIGRIPLMHRPWFSLWALLPEIAEECRVELRVLLYGCVSLDRAGQVWRIHGEIQRIAGSPTQSVKNYLAPLKYFVGRYDTKHLEGQLRPDAR
jgi:hypothetical protein